MNNKHTMNNKHEVTVTSAPAAYRVWPSGGNAWILTHDAAFVDFARLHKWEVVELFDKRQLLLVDGLPEPRIAELAEATLWLASRSLDGRIEDYLVDAITTAVHEAVSVSQEHDRLDADRWRAFMAAGIRGDLWVTAYRPLGRAKKPSAVPVMDLNSFADGLINPSTKRES